MYVISMQFGSGGPYYVRINDNGTWDEIYDPRAATEFKSQKEAEKWVKNCSVFEEYTKIVKREPAVAAFEKWMATGLVRRSFENLHEKLNTPYNKAKHTSLDVLDWWSAYASHPDPDSAVQYKIFKTWPELFQVYECLFSANGYHNEDYTRKFLSFSMAVSKKTELETFKREFDLIRDRVTLESATGERVISIFDNDLSEHGTLQFMYGDTYKIMTPRRQAVEGTLEEVFDYWKQRHWYGEPASDSDEEEDF